MSDVFSRFFEALGEIETIWLVIGFSAQAMFSARFLVQWIASERARRSVMPDLFWYFSLAGGAMLLAYAIHRADPVFILGQALGLLVYIRNIYFLHSAKAAAKDQPAE